MERPVWICGLPKPARIIFKAVETSRSRRASRTIFLNRLDSSIEIILAPGKLGCLAPRPGRFQGCTDPFFSFAHFGRRQSVFLQGVVLRINLHWTQSHHLAFKQKTDIFAGDRPLQPETEPPATFCNCQSLHKLSITSPMNNATGWDRLGHVAGFWTHLFCFSLSFLGM